MMMDRIRWAVEGLKLTGGERVLEVGPGHGVALGYCARELPEGLVVGLDRSPKMIDASARRNAGFVESGRVELIEGTPATATRRIEVLAPFDRVLALRVRALHDDPEENLRPLLPMLAPGAEIHLVFDSPGGSDLEEIGTRMSTALNGQGLADGGTTHQTGAGFSVVRAVGIAPG